MLAFLPRELVSKKVPLIIHFGEFLLTDKGNEHILLYILTCSVFNYKLAVVCLNCSGWVKIVEMANGAIDNFLTQMIGRPIEEINLVVEEILSTMDEFVIVNQAPLIESKQISPVELFDDVLRRIHKLQPKLNSFITITEEEGRKAATDAESEIRGGHYGVPAWHPDHYQGSVCHTRSAHYCWLQSAGQLGA